MTLGALNYYADGQNVGTAVDPRFGVGAAPNLPGGMTGHLRLPAFRAGLARRNTHPCVVVGLGSSTTSGSQATEPQYRYFNRLAAYVQAAYPLASGTEHPVRALPDAAASAPLGPGVAFANGGQGNTTSANYLPAARITQIGAVDPRMVIHMIGSNDSYYGTSLEAYKANLQDRLNALRGVIPRPCTHVYVHAFERFDYEKFTPVATWDEYGQALSEFVAANPTDTAFIDLTPDYEAVGVPSSDPLDIVNVDRVHQGNDGHAFMAELIATYLGIPSGPAY